MKLQNCSSLDGRVIATKVSKCLLSFGITQRTRILTSSPVSQSRVLPNNHEAGHVFSPTRKVGSAFFRTHVYCDSSPCLADPALLSVVGFVDEQNTAHLHV